MLFSNEFELTSSPLQLALSFSYPALLFLDEYESAPTPLCLLLSLFLTLFFRRVWAEPHTPLYLDLAFLSCFVIFSREWVNPSPLPPSFSFSYPVLLFSVEYESLPVLCLLLSLFLTLFVIFRGVWVDPEPFSSCFIFILLFGYFLTSMSRPRALFLLLYLSLFLAIFRRVRVDPKPVACCPLADPLWCGEGDGGGRGTSHHAPGQCMNILTISGLFHEQFYYGCKKFARNPQKYTPAGNQTEL